METMAANGGGREARYGKRDEQQQQAMGCGGYFQMPLHYPRYSREEYEAMPEWQLDRLLSEYGLPVAGTLHHKRAFAIGAFLWGSGSH
ncbi:hypothetical protein ACP70R_030710 [Stipagrostis hirtigluma subsp. patula]